MKNPTLRFRQDTGDTFSDWTYHLFSKVFSFLKSNSLPRSALNYTEGSLKNVHYGDILINFPTILNCTDNLVPFINYENVSSSFSYLAQGDIVIADAAEDYTVGKAIEIGKALIPVTAGLHTIACRPIQQHAPSFLGYYINSNAFHEQLIPLATGTKVYALNKSELVKTHLWIPCLEEQQKIASFFSTLDEKISLAERKLETLEQLKKGLMQKIFSQELRFKDENGNSFPEWKLCKIEDVASVCGGGTPSTDNESYWNGDIQWLTPTEIDSKYVHKSIRTITQNGLDNSSAKLLPYGAILLTTRATIGACSINNLSEAVCTNQGFQSLICKANVLPEFLYYAISLPSFQKDMIKNASGSTFMELSPKNLRKLNLKVPSIPEQTKVASFLTIIDNKIEAVKHKIFSSCTKYVGSMV